MKRFIEKNTRHFSIKVNSVGELKLVFLAEMQKPESHRQRKNDWNKLNNNSLASNTIASFVDTEAFWATMGRGTRFPQTMNMSTDENDLPHMATQETSNFWASVLHDMSNMHGFIQHVLQAQQTADAEPLECREHVQVCALEDKGWTVQHIATVQGHRTRACIEEYPAPHT